MEGGGPHVCVCQCVPSSAGTEGGGTTVHHQTVGPLLSRPSVGNQARAQTTHRTTVRSDNDTDRKDDCDLSPVMTNKQ